MFCIFSRFQENELRAKVLEEEKQIISQNSKQLLSSLNDLLTEQDLPEAELRLEVTARLEAERRLRVAQDSVHHLEGALQTDISPSALRTKILPDVKKLYDFLIGAIVKYIVLFLITSFLVVIMVISL